MNRHLAAFTQTQYKEYPGYANMTELDSGAIVLTVRSPEQGGTHTAVVEMHRDDAARFVADAHAVLLGAPNERQHSTYTEDVQTMTEAFGLLEQVHAWRNAERQAAFPDDLRQSIAALVAPEATE